jgi:hypothetical protein
LRTKLTPKQERFVLAYLRLGNASEAYRQAYDVSNMAPATINRTAFALLKHHKITARLASIQKRTESSAVASLAERKEFLTSTLRGLEPEAEFSDRLRAVDLLNRTENIYSDKPTGLVYNDNRKQVIFRVVREDVKSKPELTGSISHDDD